MKTTMPHDPRNDALDGLIAAALQGELSAEERVQFESRLNNDPAAQAAFQEAQVMHDLLEKTHRNAQPDAAFEQRMISGVRRKLQQEQQGETAWESVMVLWMGLKRFFRARRLWEFAVVLMILAVLGGVALGPITHGIAQAKQSAEMEAQVDAANASKQPVVGVTAGETSIAFEAPDKTLHMRDGVVSGKSDSDNSDKEVNRMMRINRPSNVVLNGGSLAMDSNGSPVADTPMTTVPPPSEVALTHEQKILQEQLDVLGGPMKPPTRDEEASMLADVRTRTKKPTDATEATPATPSAPVVPLMDPDATPVAKPSLLADSSTTPAAPIDSRKLIRDANLDLEVTSYQETVDKVTALTKAAGGYIDTSNSQKGGNGKLAGTVVAKVLPQNLDAFLLKLRDLGTVKNQSVSTQDVTKDYFDTQARLVNSQKMETQLQDLLKRENGKVADLLAVERELGRVRGDIEQMQGQLKLYDFQVQYATVTMQIAEKDLRQTAAYLLKEQDDFSLFATDVEGTFQKSRQAADAFKGEVLVATLNHNSGSDVSALLVVSVPPEQIEPFLAQVRSLGRVANFTRDTKRVAKDGGDTNQPADQTLTEKDKIMVNVSIHSDDESRKQVALTVVAKAVDDALDQAKTAALAHPGVEILSSSLNKAAQGQSTAQLSVRVPGKDYSALMESFRALGRTGSMSVQRNDNSGPGMSGDDAPVIVSLSLTDDDTPVQQTEMSVLGSNVDDESQQIKKAAGDAGVEVKASSFQRSPDGTETAQMTFRLPLAKYAAFVESVKSLGKVESLSVNRNDRPDQTTPDETAPSEINLTLHNQRDIVAENEGLWPTLRQTFGEGASALFASVRTIGVLVAFAIPWVVTVLLLAWVARRIYVWRKRS